MNFDRRTLVLLSGPIGCGKSTFASKWFSAPPLPACSADTIRELISGDAGNQNVSRDAFDILYTIIDVKMRNSFPVIVDNLNHTPRQRRDWFKLADKYGYKKVVILFDGVDLKTCLAQNAGRSRVVNPDIVKKSYEIFHDGIKHLADDTISDLIHAKDVSEPFVFQDTSVAVSDAVVDKAVVIGDTHGCLPELISLVEELRLKGILEDHKIVFVGDFADRGPSNAGILEYIMNLVEDGKALAVRGNHDDKLRRYLMGNNIKLGHGILETVQQIEARPDAKELKARLLNFLSNLPLYLVLDSGKLVVAHAGIEDSMIGKDDKGAIRTFCLYGKITGKTRDDGYPERLDWAAERVVDENSPWIVYGHAAQTSGIPYIINRTANVDTACCFGGRLTGFVYPEAETVSVPAYAKYADHASGELVRE